MLALMRERDSLLATRRRAPSQGLSAGFDVVELMPVEISGELALALDQCDKRGLPILSKPPRLLLELSKHATESLYQRLRTLTPDLVIGELRRVGDWLLHNFADVALIK